MLILQIFLSLCEHIGVQIKKEKIQLPTTILVIYGIEVVSVAMVCQLPWDKVLKIKSKLKLIMCLKKVTFSELMNSIWAYYLINRKLFAIK